MDSNSTMETIARALSDTHLQVTGVPVHVVLSDDDLLSEILLRLPVLSLLLFKSVSKQWLSLIESPCFITLYYNKNPIVEPPSGLFLMQNHRVGFDFVRLNTPNKSPLQIVLPFGFNVKGNVDIVHSCNGLVLCLDRFFKLFVYNPSTNRFKLLPGKHLFIGAKLAYDPTKSSHYKVIYARSRIGGDNDIRHPVQIHTYSSETGDWSVNPHLFHTNSFFDFRDGLYWNGAIHWISFVDSSNKLDLDVNNLVLTTMSKPTDILDENLNIDFDHKLFESRGFLLLACIVYTYTTGSQQLIVYQMRNECSKWSVKYVINIDDIKTLIPKIWEIPVLCDFVRCIVLGEREEYSFLVLEVSGMILQYDAVLNTVCKIFDFSPHDEEASCIQCFPFIPSLAGV